ncbi:glycerophosphodiester phosphodiesterase family protein [Mesomycoplasma ovipneumoniae]|uniref:Glycerophosphodiester phosphodiesterase family protein n=1 Tax=Mesomycoplasma ovipneumoniae TaxID=29562 RepID=A0AAP5Y2J8_9BACT|nr:glycerophosphodiester phosphodiesterase family protein [Mesomycoplasma ovipneumoniae]MDW2909825.1 glycerophosphodiester phosphodiesterase family protein [Mesomycoplasma ovipneumoniae]MDW2916136.1 glycerophosphodiester phosphodiesterase family protein [Mesomycoplasma ovipneumoniae]MDW2929962.1 glycerophosphodiester phosphodiesterase family protein [Mesomycoplasma ovipneumoniae]
MPKKQLLIAHRGYSGIAPENTKLAFDLAYEFNFDGIELDVHLTKDNRIVVIHDEDTKRTAGVEKIIANSTLSELYNDDHSLHFQLETRKQTILTLEDFLDLYLDKFEVINVEIKTDQTEYIGIERIIDDLSIRYGKDFFDKIIFSSFNFSTLERMFKLNSKYQLGFLFWTKTQLTSVSEKEIKQICKYLHPWVDLYDEEPAMIEAFDLPLNLWTLKSKARYQKYLNNKHVYSQISNYKYTKGIK